MREPVAQKITKPAKKAKKNRQPKSFEPPKQEQSISNLIEQDTQDLITPTPNNKRSHFLRNTLLASVSLLLTLGLGLAAERLIVDLFARFNWLGWLGIAALGIAVFAIIILAIKEIAALFRLNHIDDLRLKASQILLSDDAEQGRKVLNNLQSLYQNRADLAFAKEELLLQSIDIFDGREMIKLAERKLMTPLDIKAKQLTSASARRVAIVTAISPRAFVDVAFVAYESLKLTRAIANLYGARSGFFGSLKIAGAILSHLAVTGGVALGDSIVQQLLGHGLAAKLSARLGEGLVNGLMSVRVGIAAMKVIRPLPYEVQKQPQVMDFMADLAKITSIKDKP